MNTIVWVGGEFIKDLWFVIRGGGHCGEVEITNKMHGERNLESRKYSHFIRWIWMQTKFSDLRRTGGRGRDGMPLYEEK